MKFKNHKCRRLSKKHFRDIIISEAFTSHPPRPKKMEDKRIEFLIFKKMSPIIVDENYILVDGFCSYIIAQDFNYIGRKLKIYKAKGLDVNKKKSN